MSKLAALFVFFFFVSSAGSAQQPLGKIQPVFFYLTPYKTRNNGSFSEYLCIVSVSYGVPTVFKKSSLNLNYNFYDAKHVGIGPLSIRIEVGVRDDVGVVLFTQNAKKKWAGYFDDGLNGFDGTLYASGHSYGGLALYHFNKHIPLRNFDVYAGVGVGIFIDSWESKNAHSKPIFKDKVTNAKTLVLTGMRYYLTRHIGLFIEGGYLGYSSCNLGTSLSF